MRRIVPLLALLFIGCSKKPDTDRGNKVSYLVKCDSCTATFSALHNPKRTVEVKGYFFREEINSLDTICISTTGHGLIQSKITVDRKTLHEAINEQSGETISYVVQVK
jgi:hypothetical protein